MFYASAQFAQNATSAGNAGANAAAAQGGNQQQQTPDG
jgi:hypothetical protein